MASDHLEGLPGNKTCPYPANGTDDTHQEPDTNTKQMLRHGLKTLELIWSLLVPGSQRPSSGKLCISHCVEVRCLQCSLFLHIPLEQSWAFCGLHSPTPPCGLKNTSQGLHIKNRNRSFLYQILYFCTNPSLWRALCKKRRKAGTEIRYYT